MDSKSKVECYIQSLIGGRSENQDCAGVLNTDVGTVVVVCDGMGALNGGSTASRIAVSTVLDYVKNVYDEPSIPEILRAAILQANNAILDAAEEDEDLKGMGTTITALIINDDCATVSYVGDSRIYQLRGMNKVFRTFDHSFVFESVRIGLITEEQARLSSQSNIILRALGINRELEVDVYELPYLKGDRFVLCTDGFWGALPEKEFIAKIAKGNVQTVLEKTALQIDMIGNRNGGHHDNLTAAMFDTTSESNRKAKMSTKLKIIVASLVLALIVSISLNVYMLSQNMQDSEPAKENVADVNTGDDIDSGNISGEQKTSDTK